MIDDLHPARPSASASAPGAHPQPGGGQPNPYRLSDGERDEAISALGEAYAQGRLDAQEFEDRMAAAAAARYATDLDPLFVDLPREPRTNRAPAQAQPRTRPAPAHRMPVWRPLLIVPWFLAVILAISTHVWILLPILFLLTRPRHRSGPRRLAGPPHGWGGPCGSWR
jgi:hypothetical protein